MVALPILMYPFESREHRVESGWLKVGLRVSLAEPQKGSTAKSLLSPMYLPKRQVKI
jgi:hypothetical protein